MKCNLCQKESDLKTSHIIPKFVIDWMKKSGTGRLRQIGTFNIPKQDGTKIKLLCSDCEQLFSKQENWFKKHVFDSYIQNQNINIQNCQELRYFLISILWRVLVNFKDDGNEYKFKSELNSTELEWRNFLLSHSPLIRFQNIHFILADQDYWIDIKSDIYFSRSIDIEIAESNSICFIYAKFSRFIIIGEITGFKENSFERTNTSKENEFRSSNQMINEESVYQFFSDRIKRYKGYDDLSDNQKKVNDKMYKNKLNTLKNSDYLRILKKYK